MTNELSTRQCITRAVAERGHAAKTAGLTPEQLASWQVCKAAEQALEALAAIGFGLTVEKYRDEIADVVEEVVIFNEPYSEFIRDIKSVLSEMLDDTEVWTDVDATSSRGLATELANVYIPLAVAAKALNVDLDALAIERAEVDVERSGER